MSKIKLLLKKLYIRFFKNGAYYINGPAVLPEPLTKEQEQELSDRLAGGDDKAREQLIIHNLRLVVYIAKKFESSGVNIEDLISIGTIGLIKSVNTFCPEKNIKLATYASRCIENELLMYFRSLKKFSGDVSLSEALDTDAEGRAVFGAVSPGTYVLSYALPDAWRTTKNVEREGAIVSAVPMSADATGETEPFVLSMGQADAALYIGAMISGSIRGSAFADADDNGLWDAGEAALSGVQVDLLSASGEMIATTATDADGAYAFEGLAPGAYSVRFTARGRCFSGTSATASRGCAPRTDEEVSQTKELTVAMGGSLGDIDAGVVQTATVSGRIFEDSDGDGAMGASERMLPGVTAELIFVDSNRVLQQTVTASDGAFVFASVRPGSYSVRVTLPDGYVFTAGAPLESARDGEGTTAPVQVDAGAAVDALE